MQRSRFTVHSQKKGTYPLRGLNTYFHYMKHHKAQAPSAQAGVTPLHPYSGELIYSADKAMKGIQDELRALAARTSPLLISGEKGSGRSMIAQLFCGMDGEKRPVCVFDASAHAPSDHEKLLFGKSLSAKDECAEEGYVHRGSGGYLIIDHLMSMSLNLQNKLTKFLSHKETRKKILGDALPPRIVVIGPENIAEKVEKNKIKSDLYHFFAAAHIKVPSLRHRSQDIPFLTEFFLTKLGQAHGLPKPALSGEAMAMLVNYDWPENVSELQKILKEASDEGRRERIEKEHIPLKQESPEPKNYDNWIKNLPVGQALRTVETHFILETIKAHQGNRTYAARTLGISLRTLRNKINEFTVEGYEVMSPQSGRRSASA